MLCIENTWVYHPYLSDNREDHQVCNPDTPVMVKDQLSAQIMCMEAGTQHNLSNRDFGRIIRGVPAPSEAPGNRPDSPPSDGKGKQHANSLVHNMVQEGGPSPLKFLLRAAVSSTDAKGKIPDISKVREWQYRDLMCLPKAVQEEWKTACKEELEALHWCNVFKLTNLPKGCKTIGCRWVFDIKSDR